jgi:hypothetical protein
MADNRQLGALLILAGAALAVWSFGDRESDDTHRVSDKISVVELTGHDSDVTIEVSDSAETTVKEKRSFWLINRGAAYRVEGDKLILDGDCGWNCGADFTVTVPRNTRVTGELHSGNLTVSGVSEVNVQERSGDIAVDNVTGPVKVKSNSGEVRLGDVAGPVDVEVNSGEIKADALHGTVKAKANSGDVEVTLAAPSDVTIEGGSGDVKVTVPHGSYAVQTDTGSGEVDDDEVVPDPTAPEHRLNLSTRSGDISVRQS